MNDLLKKYHMKYLKFAQVHFTCSNYVFSFTKTRSSGYGRVTGLTYVHNIHRACVYSVAYILL